MSASHTSAPTYLAQFAEAAKVIDAKGMAVMPGGVDIHCHIVGPKVNLARKLKKCK